MVDLTDFGGGVDDDPPQVRKKTAIHLAVGGTVKHVGYIAAVETEGYPSYAYVTTRSCDTHRIKYLKQDQGGAYAVSVNALDQIRQAAHRLGSTGPGVVFVHETETGDVLEWRAEKLFEGPRVPDEFLESKGDPQRYVTPKSADARWENHAPTDFYVSRTDDRGESR